MGHPGAESECLRAQGAPLATQDLTTTSPAEMPGTQGLTVGTHRYRQDIFKVRDVVTTNYTLSGYPGA